MQKLSDANSRLNSRRCSCLSNSPRPEEGQQRLLLRRETDIARAECAQMLRAERLDRAPVEILVDDRRADVGGAANGRGVSELRGDRAANRSNCALGCWLGLHRPSLRERDRREQRATPCPEVLGT